MPKKTEDAWGTETGGFDDYVGTITDAWFAVDVAYNADALLLHWNIRSDDFENDRVEKFSVGKGWVTEDGGKTAVHNTSANGKRFNAKSAYGMIIDRVIDDEDFAGLADVLRDRGNPNQAEVWVGLTFHFRRESIDYGSGIGVKTKVLPVEWINTNVADQKAIDFNDQSFE